MQVRLLGPIDVVADGAVRPVNGLRRKAVLAALAVQCGETVSTSRLADAVWGANAPATAANTLQSHVSHLRRVLGSKAAIVARPPGYALELGADATDVRLAERLLRQGLRPADPAGGVRDLRAALALWRGEPLADVAGLAWLDGQARRLDLLHEQIQRALTEARLAAGEHASLLPDLERLAADHPLDEQVHAQLMLALYRSGRQADALAVFHRLRHTLAEDLGIDPGQPLRDLELAILRQDASAGVPAVTMAPALAGSSGPGPAALELPAGVLPAAVISAAVLPAQLPPAVATFTGRGAELADLDAMLAGPGSGDSADAATAGGVALITGTAGVGKTALAVHWAHRVRARFPDGQLYVNLRGFDPAGVAVEEGQALRGFLDAFAVPPERMPAGVADRAALYRSLLAGQRVLVVLDNARDAEQVRPLLPGSAGCMAVVTSRDHLAGLVVTEGARPLGLDLLTDAQARDLLAGRLGDRVAAEPEAAGEIVERCARLPLALTVAAARAATRPGFSLADAAAELRRAGPVLDPFDGGDQASDVRAVFSWSYRALSPAAASMFRLLGLHTGQDVSVEAAASLSGVTAGQARVLLAELTRAHLLTEHRPGRHASHDLLRAYAAEQAHAVEDQQARSAALGRYLDHYLHTAYGAATLIEPSFTPVELAPPRPGVVVGAFDSAPDALSWFLAERGTLLAAVRLAAAEGFSTHTWRLAWTLTAFLLRRGLWSDPADEGSSGPHAARRAGDAAGEAHALLRLASSAAGRAAVMKSSAPFCIPA